MPRPVDTPQAIAASRTVTTDAVLHHHADLTRYPHQYLLLHSYTLLAGAGMRNIIIAADYLRLLGFDLVGVTVVDNNLYGILRRRLAARPGAEGGELHAIHTVEAGA